MYDLRFVYVVVKIEKKDYMKDQLCGDLERFGAPLYKEWLLQLLLVFASKTSLIMQ